MEYLLTGAEMSACDRRTSEVIGIPSLVLMERAALSVADGADAFLKGLGKEGGTVFVAAGRGNNGADALAAGRILMDRGYDVSFCRLSGEISPDSSFAVQERILHSYGVPVDVYSDSFSFFPDDKKPDSDGYAVSGSRSRIPGTEKGCAGDAAAKRTPVPDVIIDGLFGTGLTRDLRGDAESFVLRINACRERRDPM